MNELEVTSRPDGEGIVRVRLAGEVDMATAALTTDAANNAIAGGARKIRMDIAEVTFLDSTGIRTLLFAQRDAADQGVRLHVVDAHHRVVRVLDITGVLETLRDGPAQQQPGSLSGRSRFAGQPISRGALRRDEGLQCG